MKRTLVRRAAKRQAIGFLLAVLFVLTQIPVSALAQSNNAPSKDATYDAIRFLEQSSFGPTPETVKQVLDQGIEKYLENQFNQPATGYPQYEFWPGGRPMTCTGDCERDNYTMYPMQRQFFENALRGQDQLRQRVAFALSQIFVISSADSSLNRMPSRMRQFQQMLYEGAFGNYRNLMYEVTLNPSMGRYLNMLGNRKFNPTTGIRPNENYARELMQLFSMGTYKLNDDGTVQLDGKALPVASYTEADIQELARALTGFIFAPGLPNPAGSSPPSVENYRDSMIVRIASNQEIDHDTGEKNLLGSKIPANQPALRDVNDALDIIFRQPNVAPFVSKRLIQSLVTSNPSPEYVKRVTEVFKNNGNGVRGDLRAVVKAILLDEEARGPKKGAPEYGKLREPVLYVTNILRAFNATSDGVIANLANDLGQNLFSPATVFGYFPYDYELPGTDGVQAPEFGIYSTVTSLRRANLVNRLVFSQVNPNPPNTPTGTKLNFDAYLPLASQPDKLIESLDDFLLHGTMSQRMNKAILDAVTAVPANQPARRVQTAAYLILTSAQYQVER